MTYQEYLAAYYDWLHKNYENYAGHEWRERLPLGKAGYICCECGETVKSAAEMGDKMGTCKVRLAPKSWQPQERA